MREVSLSELERMEEGSFVLIDTRSADNFTDTCTTCHEDGTTSSKRLETKKLIAALKESNPQIEANIFKSVSNVNLNTVIAYKKDGVRHHFLEEY